MRLYVLAAVTSLVLGLAACSGSDFAGSGAKSDAKKKDDAKADTGDDDDDDADKTKADKDKDKAKKDDEKKNPAVDLPILQKPFRPANSDTVYVPLKSDYPIPGAKDCKPSDEKIATCDDAGVKPVKVGETSVDVLVDGVPTKLKVIIYDPANPPDSVVDAAKKMSATEDSSAGPEGPKDPPGLEDDGGTVTAESSPAFGGFYRKLGHETVCQIKNPYTNDCSCPAGFEPSNFHEFYDGHNEYYCSEPGKCSITTFACWKKDNLTDNAAGIFRSYNTGACPNPNPYTGACSCPAGFSARPINEFSDLGDRYYCTAAKGGCGVQTMACTRDALGEGNSGGFYRQHNDGTCQFPNNFTNGCTCPAGYRESLLDEFTDGFKRFYCNADSSQCGMNVHACIK